MRPLSVDPPGLAQIGAGVRRSVARLDAPTAEVATVAARVGAPAAFELAGLARAMTALLARWVAFARLVALVAESFAHTEARLAASFAQRTDLGSVWSLLGGLDPDDLQALLADCPGLARLLVDRPLPLAPGTPAARLAAVLESGEPPDVVLREAHALLLALPARARRMLALLHPGLVSSLASAPVADRVAASRVLLAAAVAVASGRRLRQYDELLHGTVTLTRPDGTRLVRPHQVLVFDPRGDGRIVEVFGDLATARHLAVYVPGTGTSLDRYSGNAERASRFAAAEPDLAVVLWQDADFPDLPLDHVVPPISLWDRPIEGVQHQLRAHVFAAAFRDSADRAGPLLAHDVQGLQLAEPVAGSDLTVVGHSYGGSIVGSAEAHGMVVDRVVHIASAGGSVSDVRDYAAGECGTRRFSLTDPDDPIQLAQGAGLASPAELGHSLRTVAGVLPLPLKPLAVPAVGGLAVVSGAPTRLGHGLDPDLIPGVTRLDSGVGPDGHSLVSGHGGMFEPGSTAWRNLLAVMHGDPVTVLEPGQWQHQLVPAHVGATVGLDGVHASYANPHYVVTRSPYDAPGYRPPSESSTTPVCADRSSW
jgi:hypothetical protein